MDTCPVCLEKYDIENLDGDGDGLLQLFCGHYYHTTCLKNMVENNKVKCPLCRFETNLPKIYFAGKMHCWVPHINLDQYPRNDDGVSFNYVKDVSNYETLENPLCIRTGPYRLQIGDKHFNHRTENVQIEKLSVNMIDNSDYVCVTIDSTNCYGTIAEIGYAYAKKKQILLMIKESNAMSKTEELWFPLMFAYNSMKDICNDVIKRTKYYQNSKLLPNDFQDIVKLIDICDRFLHAREVCNDGSI